MGTGTLKTTLGAATKTTVIERPALDKDGENFRVWLATERANLPVRITTEKRGQETTLELESVQGTGTTVTIFFRPAGDATGPAR